MPRVPVSGTTYVNSRGTTVNRKKSTRRIDGKAVKREALGVGIAGLGVLGVVLSIISAALSIVEMSIYIVCSILMMVLGISINRGFTPARMRSRFRSRSRTRRRRRTRVRRPGLRQAARRQSTPRRPPPTKFQSKIAAKGWFQW